MIVGDQQNDIGLADILHIIFASPSPTTPTISLTSFNSCSQTLPNIIVQGPKAHGFLLKKQQHVCRTGAIYHNSTIKPVKQTKRFCFFHFHLPVRYTSLFLYVFLSNWHFVMCWTHFWFVWALRNMWWEQVSVNCVVGTINFLFK